ncbi:MAG: HD domain-containing protein [bacterium]|nr:HD domain-containing protein [bacterium]
MSSEDCGKLVRAAHFAAEKHRDQRRKDEAQTPYINHPLSVADLLRVFGVVDIEILSAAILHDVLEDTQTSPGEIAEQFGMAVLALVVEVSDDKSHLKQVRKDLQIENAHTLSEGARLIRLADKICNLTDMVTRPPVGWMKDRLSAYVEWCEAVVSRMPKTHSGLEARFEEVSESARQAFLARQ